MKKPTECGEKYLNRFLNTHRHWIMPLARYHPAYKPYLDYVIHLTWQTFSLWQPKTWKQTDIAIQIWKHSRETFPMINSIFVTRFLYSGNTTKLSYSWRPKKNIHPKYNIMTGHKRRKTTTYNKHAWRERRDYVVDLPKRCVHILIVSLDQINSDLRQSR